LAHFTLGKPSPIILLIYLLHYHTYLFCYIITLYFCFRLLMFSASFSHQPILRLTLLVLFFWIFSLISHYTHAEVAIQVESDIQCHFCQNVLARLDVALLQTPISQRAQFLLVDKFQCSPLLIKPQLSPQLRAPPKIKHCQTHIFKI